MPNPKGHRFSIYDAMEAQGVFDANPANSFARDPVTGQSLYTGPQEYPKMLYHPTGDEMQVTPGEEISGPYGPKTLNVHFEMIHRIVGSKDKEDEWLAKGWRTHPTRAPGAPGVDNKIAQLEAELAELRQQLVVKHSSEQATLASGKIRPGRIHNPILAEAKAKADEARIETIEDQLLEAPAFLQAKAEAGPVPANSLAALAR